MKKNLSLIFLILFQAGLIQAQPKPGDVYREYKWFNDMDDCDHALRVGGKLDYRLTGIALPMDKQGRIVPDFIIDLGEAIRAELVVEKMLCHGGTEGLRVAINGHEAITVPESPHIRKPQSSYAHHFNAIVPLPLDHLDEGRGNRFEFAVDTAGHWWPQNLVYGMVLRIYHEPSVAGKQSRIILPVCGDTIGMKARVEFDHPEEKQVQGIDLLGWYEDADLEGDGLYTQWHYAYHKGEIYQHIASLEPLKKQTAWDTEWLPDQEGPMKLAAFIHLKNGYSYMTEAVEDLVLNRPGYSVELCKPYARPKNWFTREGEHSQRFRIKGDLAKMEGAKMIFRTWSPGYFNGIYINDFVVFIKEGGKYAYGEHEIPLEAHVLQEGENILKTGKTPLYHRQMVHGVEVQWPGIMLKIKYDLTKENTNTH